MEVMEVIKKHPIPIAAGVIILLLLMRAGSSGSAPANNTAAVLNASLQSQSIAAKSNTDIAGVNAQVAMANLGATAQNYQAATAARAEIAMSDNSSIVSAFTAMLGSSNNQAAIDAQKSVQMAQINSGQAVALDTNKTNLAALNAQIAGNASITDKLIGADLQKTNTLYSFEQANLPSLMQHAENMATINGTQQVALATVNGTTATRIATINGQTAQNVAQTNTSAARTNAETGQQNSVIQGIMNIGSMVASFLG